ncbi:hypothetical protein GGR58DRAFT_526213 [Xylaria digitata]|nr:hypothetical protein GGR58DRAFT_526213 [Xylaria digitata]
MTGSIEEQPKVKKNAAKKDSQKKAKKHSNPIQKRGQPAAAARLMSSPYIKFGWHKPLSGEVKEAIQSVGAIGDSMYMLQIDRERPIESLSLYNGLFWERRQLKNEWMVSIPAIDHLDLFSEEDDIFEDTLQKISKRQAPNYFRLHYIFSSLRTREFLVLPVQINSSWVTVIARFQAKREAITGAKYFDMEITDITVIDPMPYKDARQKLIFARLRSVLAEGCIDWPEHVNHRQIVVSEIGLESSDYTWQTGLIAYAISREFLRRLKVLQFRRNCGGSYDQEFLWAPFEEDYNFDAYRQSLMSACAHQCIEGSAYRVRLALEVPSEDSNYHREKLCPFKGNRNYLANDEKWEIFEKNTHTYTVSQLDGSISAGYSPASPTFSPTSPTAYCPTSPIDPNSPHHEHPALPTCSIPSPEASLGEPVASDREETTECVAENSQPGESLAPASQAMTSPNEETDMASEVEATSQPGRASELLSKPESNALVLPVKRPFPGDYDEGAPSPTRIKIEEESS